MTAEELHILIFFIIDKNGGQGFVSPEEENIVYNRAQYAYQNYLIGEVQQYQYGRPIARIDYSQNQKIRQRLTHSIYNITLNISGGVAFYPSDCILPDALLTTDNRVIKFMSQDRLANYLDSEIDPIADNPGYIISTNGAQQKFTFYPNTLTQASLTYVRNAPAIVYATTLDGNGREIYDAANSVDPIWSEVDMLEIIVRILAIMGVPLQLQQVQAYANNIKTNGA